jgi:hypothetical protein
MHFRFFEKQKCQKFMCTRHSPHRGFCGFVDLPKPQKPQNHTFPQKAKATKMSKVQICATLASWLCGFVDWASVANPRIQVFVPEKTRKRQITVQES